MTATDPTYTPEPDNEEVMPFADAEPYGSPSEHVAEGDGTMTPTVDDPNQGEPDPPGSSLGVHQGVPFPLPIDPAKAHALLSSLMRRYKKHAEHRDVMNRSARMQWQEIEDERAREVAADEKEMAHLTEQIRPLARLLCEHDPKHRKSVSTVSGEVSFREGSASIEVVDRNAYMAWADRREDGAILIRIPPPPRPEPDKAMLHSMVSEGLIVVNDDNSLSLKGEDGERIPIPGVRQVKGEETFTVKPK